MSARPSASSPPPADGIALARKVLEYSLIMKQKVDEAKQPGFSVDSWAPLAALVDVETFERIGNFKEVMTWPQYVEFLTKWAQGSDWEGSFKRITEHERQMGITQASLPW